LQERRALGQLPPASVDAPNVLIVIWDAVRAQNLSVYGYERPTTPVLERLAQRGVLFERAFSTAPWSLPSHASIFTGRIPPEMTAGYSSPMDDSHETLSEALARAGYATGGFTGNLFYGSADYGIARGFTYYDSRPPLNFTTAAHTWWLSRTVTTRIRWSLGIRQTLLRRRADDVSAAFRKWVRRQDDRPFLAVLNHFDAHEPYLAPAPFNVAFSKTQPRYWLVNDEEVFTDEVLHDFETAYDTCILYLDSELEKLLDFLDREGELDNTLIIVTADHGEEFGEYHRRVVGHSKTLRAHSLRVPLLIVPPGGAIAERRREVASIRDIPATVMASLGLQDNQPFPGIPLLNAQARTVDPWSVFQVATMEKHRWAKPSLVWPSAAGNMFSLFAGKWHYIVDGRDGEQLYDMDNDPRQRENLIAVTALEDVVERFRVALDSLVPTVDGERLARRPGR
jgi:arylsulfatase A-like enzyme